MIIDLLPKVNLTQVNTDSGRYYVNDNGNKFDSVTTMLSKTKDMSTLNKWKKRVGKKEAQKVIKESTDKGTSLHNSIEQSLLYNTLPQQFNNELEEKRFNSINTFLQNDIKILKGCELPLYSKSLSLAGTCDIIYINHNDELIVGDLKTSLRKKKDEWLIDYYLQITIYSIMLYECYNLCSDKGKIIMSVENEINSDHAGLMPYSFDFSDYFKQVKKRINTFHSLIGKS